MTYLTEILLFLICHFYLFAFLIKKIQVIFEGSSLGSLIFFHLYLTYLWCFKKFWSVVLFANGTNLFFAHTEILDRRKWTLVAYTC